MTTAPADARPDRARKPALGIRGRLAILTVVVTLAVLVPLGAVLGAAVGERARAAARDRAAALLESLAVPAALDLAQGALERIDDSLAELAKAGRRGDLPLVEVAMLDHRGRLITRSGGGPSGESLLHDDFEERATDSDRPVWQRTETPDGRELLLLSMPSVSGLRWGTLVAAFDLSQLEATIAATHWIMVGIGLALAVLMVLVLYFALSKLLIRRVRELARTVERLQGGDLSARADLSATDEIGELARGFNAMAGELQSYTEGLERRVEERSAEVRRKNDELQQVNRRLEEVVDELAALARRDPLTDVYNRRHFFELLDFEVRRGRRAGHKMSLLMLDVDHFKQFNDTFGHQAGDAVLRGVANVLLEVVRSTDVVARYGGEEFVILLLDTGRDDAVEVAEKVRQSVVTTRFTAHDGQLLDHVSVSIGVVTWPQDADSIEELVERADDALYRAKRGGRDQVVTWATH